MDFTAGITYAQDQEIEFLNEQIDRLQQEVDGLAGRLNVAYSKLAQIEQIAR